MACVFGFAMIAPAASAADTASFQATLNPISANNVTGSGASWITVNGNSAEIKIQVNGLLDGAPHAQHIHIDAQGKCPSAAQQHNGQPSINVADGVRILRLRSSRLRRRLLTVRARSGSCRATR